MEECGFSSRSDRTTGLIGDKGPSGWVVERGLGNRFGSGQDHVCHVVVDWKIEETSVGGIGIDGWKGRMRWLVRDG